MRKIVFALVGLVTTGPALGRTALEFEEVARGLVNPVAIAHSGDGTGRLFVLELEGRVRILRDGELLERPFLDISTRVLRDGEGGLLGLAFHPNYKDNHRFFLFYSTLEEGEVKAVVAEYRASPSDADLAVAEEETRLLVFDHPSRIHFGGDLKFGPDGYLYISSGDAQQQAMAQDGQSLLGKILRIDVDRGDPYAAPAGNPFFGDPEYRPEVWALGFRNPWRIAIDPRSGEVFAGDVGTGFWEEVNLVRAGRNYGWPTLEGFDCRSGAACDPGRFEPPLLAYDHRENDGVAAVIGGTVYRGSSPTLFGAYLYADFVSRRTWELRETADGWRAREAGRPGFLASAYGEGESGDLYALDINRGRIYRIAVRSRQSFAQAGAGSYPGGRLVSELVMSNPWDRDIEVTLRGYAPDGGALPLLVQGVEASLHRWTLPARTARTVRLELDGPLQTGWLSLDSDREVGATLRVLWSDDEGERLAAVGLEPSLEACDYVVEGVLDPTAGISAGVAVVNPFAEDSAEVRIEFVGTDGETLAEGEFVLDGLQQSAQVLESIAPNLQSFAGTIRIRSERPVLIATVGTRRGLATESVRGDGFCGLPPGTVADGFQSAAAFEKEKK